MKEKQERAGLRFRVPSVVETVRFLTNLSDTTLAFARNASITLVLPILSLGTYVEGQRVLHGILLFESEYPVLAGLGAALLVMSNVVIEIIIDYIDEKHEYEEPLEQHFSFRIYFDWLLYVIGFFKGKKWEVREKPPSARWRRTKSFITFSILLLALIGSLEDQFKKYDDVDWFEGIVEIATKSSINELMTILSGFIFAAAVVGITQAYSSYASKRAIEFTLDKLQDEIKKEKPTKGSMSSDLKRLLSLISEYPSEFEGDGVIIAGKARANMVDLSWSHEDMEKDYGPYKNRGALKSSVTTAIKRIK